MSGFGVKRTRFGLIAMSAYDADATPELRDGAAAGFELFWKEKFIL